MFNINKYILIERQKMIDRCGNDNVISRPSSLYIHYYEGNEFVEEAFSRLISIFRHKKKKRSE